MSGWNADAEQASNARPHAAFPDRVETARLILRPLQEDDVTLRYLSWFRDLEIVRYLEARNLARDEVIAHMRQGYAADRFRMYAICLKPELLHIGNIKLGPIDWRHLVSDLVTVIGDRSHNRRGIAAEAIAAMTAVGFRDLGLRKFSGGAYATNLASIRAYLAAGWIAETELVGHYIVNGAPTDRVILSCFNPAVFPKTPPGSDRWTKSGS